MTNNDTDPRRNALREAAEFFEKYGPDFREFYLRAFPADSAEHQLASSSWDRVADVYGREEQRAAREADRPLDGRTAITVARYSDDGADISVAEFFRTGQ